MSTKNYVPELGACTIAHVVTQRLRVDHRAQFKDIRGFFKRLKRLCWCGPSNENRILTKPCEGASRRPWVEIQIFLAVNETVCW
jgi:hypothetical protein